MGWPNFFPQFWSQFISKSHKPHSCTVICFCAYLNVDRCKQSYLLWVWFKLNLQFLLEILGSNPPRFFFGLTWYLILCHVSEDAQNIHLDFFMTWKNISCMWKTRQFYWSFTLQWDFSSSTKSNLCLLLCTWLWAFYDAAFLEQKMLFMLTGCRILGDNR